MGWWGNTFGIQTGFKYIDVAGISNLDIQGEYNIVRPYTYTHSLRNDLISNYTHYNQPMAHPLGANFYEVIGIVRYQPISRLNVIAKVISSYYGEDTPGTNNGGNIFLPSTTRDKEYFNTTAQGIFTNIMTGNLTITYQLKHNLFFDLNYIYRNLNSEDDVEDTQLHFGSVAFRMNIPQKHFDF